MSYEKKIINVASRIRGLFKPNEAEQLFHAVEMADHNTALQLTKQNPQLMFTAISSDKLNRETQSLHGIELSPLQLACYNYDMALLNSFYEVIADDTQAQNKFSLQLYLFKLRYSIEGLKTLYDNQSWSELTKHQQEELPVVFLKEFCTRSNWYEEYDFSEIKSFKEPVFFTYLDFDPLRQMLIKNNQLNFNYVLCRHEQYKICSCIVEAPIKSMEEDLAGFISLHQCRKQQLEMFLIDVKAVKANQGSVEYISTDPAPNSHCTIL